MKIKQASKRHTAALAFAFFFTFTQQSFALDPDRAGVPEYFVTGYRNCMSILLVSEWSTFQSYLQQGYDMPPRVLNLCKSLPQFEKFCTDAGNSINDCYDAAIELAKQSITMAGARCGFGQVCP